MATAPAVGNQDCPTMVPRDRSIWDPSQDSIQVEVHVLIRRSGGAVGGAVAARRGERRRRAVYRLGNLDALLADNLGVRCGG
jgi:hypothetical protein